MAQANNTNVKNTFQPRKFKKGYKAKQKDKQVQPKVIRKAHAPVFTYTSECCKAPATKKPCVRSGERAYDEQPLGSWRCTECKKPAKVTRSKNKEEETCTSTNNQQV